jgi:hypothetical protein
MTRHANSLTERATKPTAGQTVWSMPARDVRVFVATLGRLGYNEAGLIAEAGLDSIDFTDPDLRISCDSVGKVILAACRQRLTPNLSLELARHTPMGAYPLLDYLVVTCDTVEAGVRQLSE